jgi:hypothetical protein
MVSVIQEDGDAKGPEGLLQQHSYSNYPASDSSPYSLFVLAIRSSQTKQKYLQRLGYFLDFAQVGTGNETSIEERCNKLAELTKSDYKWLLNCIFNYLQFLKTRVDQSKSKLLLLEITSSLSNYSVSKSISIFLGKSLHAECRRKENTRLTELLLLKK